MFKTRHKIAALFGLAIILGVFVGLQQPAPRPAPSAQDIEIRDEMNAARTALAASVQRARSQQQERCETTPVALMSVADIKACEK